jgi:DnaJ family protein C protein 3
MGDLANASFAGQVHQDGNLKKEVGNAKRLLRSGRGLRSAGELGRSLIQYKALLKICPFRVDFLCEAARIAMAVGNSTESLILVERALSISNKCPEALYLRGQYFFSRENFTFARRYLRLCDSKKCAALLKRLDAFEATLDKLNEVAENDWAEVSAITNELDSLSVNISVGQNKLSLRLKSLRSLILIHTGKKEESLRYLNDVITFHPTSKELVMRGEILMELGDLKGAYADFQSAKVMQPDNSTIGELLENVTKMLEQEKSMNYYDILGVSRKATDLEIKEAFRQTVLEWHPDRFNNTVKRAIAERKMKQVNNAYDVLGDEQKRNLYDRGENPESAFEEEFQKGNGR